jgi:N6-L-threonylcarbamoyladenine synthase/protein kinase Bud32
MSEEHYVDFFMPPMKYCGDNGAMIAWMGQLMYKNGLVTELSDTRVIQKYRTDEVNVPWMKSSKNSLKLPSAMIEKGAEANIYSGHWMDQEVIIKKRIPKSYRIEELDNLLRKKRTKKEAKLLGEAKRCGVKTPLLYDIDKEENAIVMDNVEGIILKNIFEDLNDSLNPNRPVKNLCENIGKNIAKLHNCNIIHGDLTSSNMILQNNHVYFIDFGLGTISDLIEDKGVDLLVFKKAISGIHHNIADECFKSILKGYDSAFDYEKVVTKVKEIESRGRYKSNLES